MTESINQLHHRQLPAWLQSEIAHPPTAGSGIHTWLFKCAKGLKAWRTTQQAYETSGPPPITAPGTFLTGRLSIA